MTRSHKVLINFGALKAGGGQTVALNFLQSLSKAIRKDLNVEFEFLTAKGSAIEEWIRNSGSYKFFSVPRNPFLRVLFEMTFISLLCLKRRYHAVYSYFGFAMIIGSIKQIIGSADSNLYYPEVDFWGNLPRQAQLRKQLIDIYRIFGLRHAWAVVYENEEMERRGNRLFGLKRTKYIPPSITRHNWPPVEDTSIAVAKRQNRLRLLMLCGWQENKNILMMPQVLSELRFLGYSDAKLVISVKPDHSAICSEFMSLVNYFDVSSMISMIGRVDRQGLPSVYLTSDIVLLLSLLESFSNNIVEAWYFGIPLVCADEQWAHSLCGEAAAYVPRQSASSIAKLLIDLKQDSERQSLLKSQGRDRLASFPSITDRTIREIEYVVSVTREL